MSNHSIHHEPEGGVHYLPQIFLRNIIEEGTPQLPPTKRNNRQAVYQRGKQAVVLRMKEPHWSSCNAKLLGHQTKLNQGTTQSIQIKALHLFGFYTKDRRVG
jgi:hypothetical protein